MKNKKIGIISDTHSLLRPEVLEIFKGVDLIIHGGDIGSPQILESLRKIAPVVAVLGNNDRWEWNHKLSKTELIDFGDIYIYLLHDIDKLDIDPKGAGIDVVISGHSHRPSERWKEGILFLNPGSAGPLRFNLPTTVAFLYIKEDGLEVEFVDLKNRSKGE